MTVQKRLPTAILTALLLAAPASAATVNVTMQGSNAFRDGTGHNAWYQQTAFSLNGVNRSGAAGVFRLVATDIDGATRNFLAFCLEPLETLTLPRLHTVGTTLGGPVLDRLGALMSNAFGLVTNATTAAAFQIAAWEIANEGSDALDLKSGAFRLNSSSAKTRGLAQTWLDAIAGGNWTASGDVTILSAPGTQDLLTDIPAPAPLPAAGFGLLAALAGLAGLRRRPGGTAHR